MPPLSMNDKNQRFELASQTMCWSPLLFFASYL
jgi:hypothetical protein